MNIHTVSLVEDHVTYTRTKWVQRTFLGSASVKIGRRFQRKNHWNSLNTEKMHEKYCKKKTTNSESCDV